MKYEEQLKHWLSQSFEEHIPPDVVAYSFNLLEPAGIPDVKFAIELVGTDRFKADDPDWACDEIWNPRNRIFAVPSTFSTTSWERCFLKIRKALCDILDSDEPFVKKLKQAQGIGVGFVDGDLEIIWKS